MESIEVIKLYNRNIKTSHSFLLNVFETSKLDFNSFIGVFTNLGGFFLKSNKYNMLFIWLHRALKFCSSFELFEPASVRSYMIGFFGNNWLVGWLVGWSVGNAVFSETALRIFLIFCMKLGDYKGRKVTKPDFLNKILDLEIWKGLQISIGWLVGW